MAFKINKVFGIKEIIILVLSAIPLIVSTNIDCEGKPFHCINSTHFMICVDLGGGVSITVDNFIIPCPPTTVCQGTNRFECEFAPTTPKLEVIPIDGARNVGIIATTSLPDVIKPTNGIFEENFNTVSTTKVSENKAIQFTTRQPEEIVTNQLGNEEDGKFKSVSTPYIESGLEISTAISNIIEIDVNISKESINLFLDKKSEIIAIANNTYANGKEQENLLTRQNNGDISPTEALLITRINTPTEVISTTSNITTTNAESLELALGRFENKTHFNETNIDIVTSTNSVTFKNIAPTNELATTLPAYEITTDKLLEPVEYDSFAIKYNKIDMFTTTEKYHNANTTERLTINDLSVRNDAISENLTTKNEFNNNNEIIEAQRDVSTIASNDLTTTAFNTNYYETKTVQTTQLYDETITETLNPAADVMMTENSDTEDLAIASFLNIDTGITPGYEALTTIEEIFTQPLIAENMNGFKYNEKNPTHSTETAGIISRKGNNATNDTTSNSTETTGLTFTTENNVTTEITSNSTETADVLFTTEGYETNDMTLNKTETAGEIFTAGSNSTNDTKSNSTETANVMFTTKSKVMNYTSNSTETADVIFTRGSNSMNDITSDSPQTDDLIFTTENNVINNMTSNSTEAAGVIFPTESNVISYMSNSTGTSDLIFTTVLYNPIEEILKGETSTALVITEEETSTDMSFSLIQNTTDSISTIEGQTIALTPVNITSNKTNSEVSENEFTTPHSFTNSGVKNSTEPLQELYLTNSTQSKSSDAQETSMTDTASSDATTQSVIFHESGETTTTQIKYWLEVSSNITDKVREFDSITNGRRNNTTKSKVMNYTSNSTETPDVIFTRVSSSLNDITSNSPETDDLIFTTESNVISYMSNSKGAADVIFTKGSSSLNDIASNSPETDDLIFTTESNVINNMTSNSTGAAGVTFTTESNVINYMSNSTGTLDVIFAKGSNVMNNITSNSTDTGNSSMETADVVFTAGRNAMNKISANSTETADVIFTRGSSSMNDITSNSQQTDDLIFTIESNVINNMTSNSTEAADVTFTRGSSSMNDITSNSPETDDLRFTTESNVINNITSNSTETADVIFTRGSSSMNDISSNSPETDDLIFRTASNVINNMTSNSTEAAGVTFTRGSSSMNDITSNSPEIDDLIFTTESNVINNMTSNSTETGNGSMETADVIFTAGSNTMNNITSNSTETAGVIFTTGSNVIKGMTSNNTEAAGVIFTAGSNATNDTTSNSTETVGAIFTTKSYVMNDMSNSTETADVIFRTGSNGMNDIKSNSPETTGVKFTTESNVINNMTSNSTEAAGVIFTTESNVINYMSNSTETADLIFTTVLYNPIKKILKGETSTALVITEAETSTDTSLSLIKNTTDSISETERQTIALTPVNITSNKTNSEVSENEFTTPPSFTNAGINNSTKSLQELYLINSTQSKSSDAQETSMTDTASSDATTQSVIFHESGETTTTQIKYWLEVSSNITDKVREFDSITNGHLKEVITDGSSKKEMIKENNLVPSPMPLLQDMMTGKSHIGQEEDNLSKKNNRTIQLKNKDNPQYQPGIVIPSIIQDNLEKNIKAPTLISTEDSLKNSVDNSVQPSKLSELVMIKATTPKVIDPSYLSTPHTTKWFQVLLNKSDDAFTETIQENYAQHNESININERNPLSLKMSQHIDTLTIKMTNSPLNDDMKRIETAKSSSNIAEISRDMSILIKINNNEDHKKDTLIYTSLSNINAFKINDSIFTSEVPVTSNLNSENGTTIQPSNFSLITPPTNKLDAAASIQNNLNPIEQINSPKIESLSTVSSLVGIIDQEKTRNLDFSINSDLSTENPKYLSEDMHVTVGQNTKLYTDNLLDVIEGISRPVSNVQSDLETTFAVTFDEKTLSMTTESYIAKLQGPSEMKNTHNLVSNDRLNEQKNTSLNRNSTLLPTSDSKLDFQNVSDFQVYSLNRKDIATETLPLANISDSNREQISKQSLKVTVTTIGTTETFNTTKYYFHETTDQMNKSYFNCLNYSRGRYADKDNCRKFYICVGKFQPIEGMCPVDTVFSEIRKQCTKNLSQCIRNNQFLCTSEGRYGDFLQDNIYYICVRNSSANDNYIRFKLQCQNGYYLNQTSVKCIRKVTESNQSLSSNQSLTSNSENTNIYNSSSQSVTIRSQEKPSGNKIICEGEGKFADPNDCRKYYVCYKNSKSVLKRKKKECDSDEVFDKDTKKCKESESSEC